LSKRAAREVAFEEFEDRNRASKTPTRKKNKGEEKKMACVGVIATGREKTKRLTLKKFSGDRRHWRETGGNVGEHKQNLQKTYIS